MFVDFLPILSDVYIYKGHFIYVLDYLLFAFINFLKDILQCFSEKSTFVQNLLPFKNRKKYRIENVILHFVICDCNVYCLNLKCTYNIL